MRTKPGRGARRERLLDLREIASSIKNGETWTINRIASFKGYKNDPGLRQAERRYNQLETIAAEIGAPIKRVGPDPGAVMSRWFITSTDLDGLLKSVERELELLAAKERREREVKPTRRQRDKTESALRIRAERIAAGLCATQGCENKAQDETLFCRGCRSRQSEASGLRREKLKDLGICVICANEPVSVEGDVLGPLCAEKQKAYLAEYHAQRKRDGLCQKCGVNEPESGRATCEACLEISRAKQTTDDFRKRRRELKAERKEKGLCIYTANCDEKVEEGRTMCRTHLDYFKSKGSEYRQKKETP